MAAILSPPATDSKRVSEELPSNGLPIEWFNQQIRVGFVNGLVEGELIDVNQRGIVLRRKDFDQFLMWTAIHWVVPV